MRQDSLPSYRLHESKMINVMSLSVFPLSMNLKLLEENTFGHQQISDN